MQTNDCFPMLAFLRYRRIPNNAGSPLACVLFTSDRGMRQGRWMGVDAQPVPVQWQELQPPAVTDEIISALSFASRAPAWAGAASPLPPL
jgi:hypothetical protein